MALNNVGPKTNFEKLEKKYSMIFIQQSIKNKDNRFFSML